MFKQIRVKLSVVIAYGLLSYPVFGFATPPLEVRCEDDRQNGHQLVVRDMGRTGWEPSLEVAMERQGQSVQAPKVMLIVQNDSGSLRLEGRRDHRTDIFISISFRTGRAVYAEVSDEGLSPLPPVTFNNCRML